MMKPRLSFQTGWIREVPRSSWKVFKLYWRERDSETEEWSVRTKTLPRYQQDGRRTLRKHAEKELQTVLAPINARNAYAPPVLRGATFNGLLDLHWTDYVERQKLRRSTLDGYTAMLENWIKPFFGEMPLHEITKATVGEFFGKLREEKLTDKYQKNVYSLLTKLFDIAVAYDLLPLSPVNKTLHRPHLVKREKPVLPAEKLKAFFEALSQSWRTPLAVLLLTGMRQGELLGLRWMDIDFTSKMIHKRNVVYRGELIAGLKDTRRAANGQQHRQHAVGMSGFVETLLAQHKAISAFAADENFVFSRADFEGTEKDSRPLDPDHIRRYVLYPAMLAAKIPVESHSSGLHMFRHTVVSELAKRQGLLAAQHQAGHASISTTANIYTHVDEQEKKQSALALQEAFGEKLNGVVCVTANPTTRPIATSIANPAFSAAS